MQRQNSGEPTLRPAAPDPELIEWLWSAEGQAWSKVSIHVIHHAAGALADIKNDHECNPDHCVISNSIYPDNVIRVDIERYGMNGVPEEWRNRRMR